MQHGMHSTFDTTHDFLTYGAIGLEVDRANERRQGDWIASEHLIPGRSLEAVRHRIGAWLIGLGEHLAGARTAAPAAR